MALTFLHHSMEIKVMQFAGRLWQKKTLKYFHKQTTRQTWFKIQTVVQIIWKQTKFLRSVYIA